MTLVLSDLNPGDLVRQGPKDVNPPAKVVDVGRARFGGWWAIIQRDGYIPVTISPIIADVATEDLTGTIHDADTWELVPPAPFDTDQVWAVIETSPLTGSVRHLIPCGKVDTWLGDDTGIRVRLSYEIVEEGT